MLLINTKVTIGNAYIHGEHGEYICYYVLFMVNIFVIMYSCL
ncbi:hypothetical protein LTSEHVI_2422 [Salmonella enterica subsp. enterica serovar Hvittingfoss str. A4-620]|nr:hypothetical protein LTSEHVI_2422 [Salmonella enterica subsp. enterica serovar Hvittingfoss str. A4-620]